MLHEFLTSHKAELLRRCRSKVSQRSSPPVTQLELEHGIPLFLGQLVEALRCEEEAAPSPQLHRHIGFPKPTLVSIESGRTAALHGKELLDEGFTLDQVVHGYGDVCQAITELAQELRAPITVAEFHTFNRLLDNAIAEAVASYVTHPEFPCQNFSLEDQRALAERGCLLERCLSTPLSGKTAWEHVFDGVRAVGVESSLFSSDCGNPDYPPVEDGLALWADRLLGAEFDEDEVRELIVGQSRRLAGAT
jgi:hypothetical protein